MEKYNTKILGRVKADFIVLSKKAKHKALIYKSIDLLIKVIIAVAGAIITFFSDSQDEELDNFKVMRALGIIITSVSAVASIFMFEKRSLSNIQIHTKCQNIIPEIEDKIERKEFKNTKTYIRSIYKELSLLSIASFTDSISGRNIKLPEELEE